MRHQKAGKPRNSASRAGFWVQAHGPHVSFHGMIPPGSATGLVFQMEHFLLGAWCTGGQHVIMSCFMVLWIRNSGRAQPGDSFVPCGISQGYLVVPVGSWVICRILDEFTACLVPWWGWLGGMRSWNAPWNTCTYRWQPHFK